MLCWEDSKTCLLDLKARRRKVVDWMLYLKTRGKAGRPHRDVQTNPRYREFTQEFYHCGDEEQFLARRLLPTKGFSSSEDAVMNTFSYMFHKFKKGIYVQIRDGSLNFLPFCKKNYLNELPELKWDGDKAEMLRVAGVTHPSPEARWFTNDYLLRCDDNQNGSNVRQFLYALRSLLDEYDDIPDVEFFINKRDFPLLKSDGTEPYESIWGESCPLVSHRYEYHAPILSMVECRGYEDVAIPTCDDWNLAALERGDVLCPRTVPVGDVVPWEDKVAMAVWRGTATGRGISPFDNLRLKLCATRHPLLDAGLTNCNYRLRVVDGVVSIQSPSDFYGVRFAKSLSVSQQARYRYIISVPGHVAPFRLSREFGYGSCILLAPCRYKLWFESKIFPWVHYVPLEADLSDLREKLDWCAANDDKCRQIGANAREFYEVHLNRKAMLEHLRDVVMKISSRYDKKVGDSYECHRLDRQLSRYSDELEVGSAELGDVIARGGCTEVYISDDYLVKIGNHVENLREAWLGSQNIGRALGLVVTERGCGVKMTWAPGEPFDDWLRGNTFSWRGYVELLQAICAEVQKLQQSGVTHWDLAPWNVIVEDGTATLIDFGKASVGNHCLLPRRTPSPGQDIHHITMTSLKVLRARWHDRVVCSGMLRLFRFFEYARSYSDMKRRLDLKDYDVLTRVYIRKTPQEFMCFLQKIK